MSSTDPQTRLYAVRRVRLRLLRAEFKTTAAFAAHIGESPSYVSRLLQTHPKGRKNIGEEKAREIEGKCGKGKGWLDVDRSGPVSALSPRAEPPVWPFQFPYKMWDALTPPEKARIEDTVVALILHIEAQRQEDQVNQERS